MNADRFDISTGVYLPSRQQALCLNWAVLTLIHLFVIAGSLASAQSVAPPNLTVPASNWITEATANEAAIIDHPDVSLRYLSHRVDAKGDTVRDSIDSAQGTVARMVERNGRPLTQEEDKAERDRLEDVLKSPTDFAHHHHRDAEERKYTLDLVKLMPDAMLYSYTAGQPQPPDTATPQIAVDFKPNPAFHPPNTAAELLTGLEGRIWIDAAAHRMTRIEAHVVKPINLGWGLLVKVYPGGTLVFAQTDVGGGTWVYSHLDEHVTVRELMVKTDVVTLTATGSHFEAFPAISWQEAIHRLLNTPLPASVTPSPKPVPAASAGAR